MTNRYTVKLLKALPNMLTLLRAVLACILNIYISICFGRLAIPTLLFTIIFLTDFLDGRIARRYGYVSKRGAVLDILADFFYIVLSYIVLCSHNVIPIWFFIIVVFKFMEFLFTSRLLRHRGGGDSIFVFDFIGRYVAVFFYGMPLLAYISFITLASLHNIALNIICGGVSVIAIISSSYRFWNCYMGIRPAHQPAPPVRRQTYPDFNRNRGLFLRYRVKDISRGQ